MSIKIILLRLLPNDHEALKGGYKNLRVNFGLLFRIRGWSPAERHRGSTLSAWNLIKRTALLRPPGPASARRKLALKMASHEKGKETSVCPVHVPVHVHVFA